MTKDHDFTGGVVAVKKLIIIGAGGFGREVAWLVERINKAEKTWNILGFLDDKKNLAGKHINNYPVLGCVEDAEKFDDCSFVCAIACAKTRKKIVENLKETNKNISFATLKDPSSEISDLTQIGEGSVICARAIITVNVKIGSHVIVDIASTIGHDAVLDDYVTLYPNVNVSGFDKIGVGCEIGVGSQIIQGKSLEKFSIVGAGAVVIDDIPENCTAVGCPAKAIKFN